MGYRYGSAGKNMRGYSLVEYAERDGEPTIPIVATGDGEQAGNGDRVSQLLAFGKDTSCPLLGYNKL